AGEDEHPNLALAGVVDRAPQFDQRLEVDGVTAFGPIDGEDDVAPAVLRPDHGSSTATTSPSCTLSSGATRSSATVPARGAVTGISIFMDSRMTSSSPSATRAPTLVRTCQTLAVISARTSVMAGDGTQARRSARNGNRARTAATTAGSTSATSTVSPPAADAS